MRETFSSEGREYQLDSTRLMEFLDELQEGMKEEFSKRRASYHLFVNPAVEQDYEGSIEERLVAALERVLESDDEGALISLQQQGRFLAAEEFYGRSLSIAVERSEPPMLVSDSLGEIVISEDGTEATLYLDARERLATDPEVVCRVAEKYSI